MDDINIRNCLNNVSRKKIERDKQFVISFHFSFSAPILGNCYASNILINCFTGNIEFKKLAATSYCMTSLIYRKISYSTVINIYSEFRMYYGF